jgi:hypothetical protein
MADQPETTRSRHAARVVQIVTSDERKKRLREEAARHGVSVSEVGRVYLERGMDDSDAEVES